MTFRTKATNAASSPITTAQTIGFVAASLSEYRAYRPASARVSSASAAAASGVRTGIHFAAAGTTSRTAHTISSTPSARHPPRESARRWFASSSNLNTLYDPPARYSRASATWRIHKRTFIVFSLSSLSLVSTRPCGRGGAREHLHERTRTDGREDKRSEEHTSELQSQSNLVCRLLLEKKKNHQDTKQR